MAKAEKRIFIGGLFTGVTEQDLKEKFSRFGQVGSIEIKTRHSEAEPKTFAYLNLCTGEASFKKCFSAYNNTNWKGGQLKLQFAKESFLNRREQERKEEKAEKVKKTKEVPWSEAFDVKDTKAVPGTPIDGKKDWVMGKYSRPLPILHVKKPHSRKIVTLDPSKTTHALKKIKADDFDVAANSSSDNLTWHMEVKDTEITKKRKGQFPPWQPSKRSSNGIAGRLHQLPTETHTSDNELEVVSTARVPSLQIIQIGRYDSDDSDFAGSADTDEIIAQSSKQKTSRLDRECPERTTQKDDKMNYVNVKEDTQSSRTQKSHPIGERSSQVTPHSVEQNSRGKQDRKQRVASVSVSELGTSKRLNTSQSSVPKPKFVKVDKARATAIRTLGKCASEVVVPKGVTCCDDTDSSDSDAGHKAKKKKKSEKPVLEKIPEFKGLGMLSDYSDGETKLSHPQTNSTAVIGSTNVVHTESSHADNFASSGSSDEDSDNDKWTKSGTKMMTGLKGRETSIPGAVLSHSPEKNHGKPGPDDDSEDTNDILSASVSKQKLASKSKATVVSERRTITDTPGIVSFDEFESGLADLAENRQSLHPDTDDSDFDSNDFELVVKKMAARLQSKQQPKMSKPQQSVKMQDDHKSELSQSVRISPEAGSKLKQKPAVSLAVSAEVSNQRRLQAIAEKNAEQKRQQALIQKALEGDNQESKSHKFFSDSEEDNGADSHDTKPHQQQPQQQQLQLFSESGQESNSEEDAEQTFRLRLQFQGEKGKKLMALQSRFGRDMRFRMDERFQESDSDDEEEKEEEDGKEENAAKEEKARALKILETVVGHKVSVPSHKGRIFKDMNKLRYIPGSDECKHMEVQDTEPKKKKKKQQPAKEGQEKREASTPDLRQRRLEPSQQQSEQPKDNAERYFEVSSHLKDLFSGSVKPFSFLGTPTLDSSEAEEEITSAVPELSHKANSSSEESCDSEMLPEEQPHEEPVSPIQYTSFSTLETCPGPRKAKRWQDDPRLAAAVRYFKRSDNWEEVVEQWSARRSELMEFVKLRQKRHQRKVKERERGGKKKWSKC